MRIPLPPLLRTNWLPSLLAVLWVFAISGCAHRVANIDGRGDGEARIVIRGQAPEMPPRENDPHGGLGMPIDSIDRGFLPQNRLADSRQDTAPPPMSLHLRDAIAMALSRSDVIRTLNGIESVTGYDPAIADAQSSAESGVFAPQLRMAYDGGQLNGPPETFFGPGISTQSRYDEGDFTAELSKLWPLGTTTRIAHDPSSLGYLFFPNSGPSSSFNPAYSSAGVFEVRQPLLRGFGPTLNTAPIRIAQTRAEQSRWQVEEVTNRQVRSVEESYWNLHAAHVGYQATQAVVTLAQEAVRLEELRYQAERSTYADLARTKVQLERLRQQSSSSRFRLAEQDIELRQLIGLESDGSPPLVPADLPRQELVEIDISVSVSEALAHRPDLQQRRHEIERLDLQRQVAKNQTRPQLDARYQLRTNGLGNHYDDAARQAASLEYTDWTIGLEFSMPLGNQQAKSRLFAREMEVSRERARLREYEHQIAYDMSVLASETPSRWEQADSALREFTEAERWLKLATIRYQNPRVADANRNLLLAALDDFQTAMQAYVNARTGAAASLARYNITLARIEEAKGTLLDHWRIEFETGDASHSQRRETPISNYGAVSFESPPGAGHSMRPSNDTRRGHSLPVRNLSSGQKTHHQNSVRR